MKLLGLLALLPFLSRAQNNNYVGTTPTQRHVINQVQALEVINAANAMAQNISVPQNIAVVDPSGLLIAFLHGDNAYPGSIDISMKKAKTVALFNGQFTTADLYNATQPGGGLYGIEITNGGLVVFGGGLPIFLNGDFIGAVGVSGGTVDQDVLVATAGAQAVGSLSQS